MKQHFPLLPVVMIFTSLNVFGHGDVVHEKKEVVKHDTSVSQTTLQSPKVLLKKDDALNIAYKEINTLYLQNIKPIFEKKCFDCHSDNQHFPWYYKIPGIKQMIDHDIKEAKKHMNMKQDFPFISHETPLKDLESIREIGEKGGMPHFRYIIGHWDSILTDNEKKNIILWTEKSILLLK